MIHRAAILMLLTASMGCSGGNAASELAKAPALDEAKCGVKKSQAKPLIVEWPSPERVALEARAKDGLVAVRYVGCEMEVLRRCKVPGKYNYVATTRQDDKISIKDEDDLYANMPIYAAKFESRLHKAGQLGVHMAMVGSYEADRETVRFDELSGDCRAATHIIVALTAGAFELATGAEAEVGAGAEVGPAAAGASSKASRETLNKGGDPKACDAATSDDKRPPDGCGALVRIEVAPIQRPARAEAPPGPPPPHPVTPAQPGETAYRKQLRITGDEFTRCLQEDARKCEARCKAGDTPACREVGQRYAVGINADADGKRAEYYLYEACNKGKDGKACDYLSSFYAANAPMKKRDQKKAEKYRQMACDLDWAQACHAVGSIHWAFKRKKKAIAAHKKACDLGLTQSCAAIEE